MKISRHDDPERWHGMVNALCIKRPREHATSPIVHNSHSESFLDHQLDSDVHSHVWSISAVQIYAGCSACCALGQFQSKPL